MFNFSTDFRIHALTMAVWGVMYPEFTRAIRYGEKLEPAPQSLRV